MLYVQYPRTPGGSERGRERPRAEACLAGAVRGEARRPPIMKCTVDTVVVLLYVLFVTSRGPIQLQRGRKKYWLDFLPAQECHFSLEIKIQQIILLCT